MAFLFTQFTLILVFCLILPHCIYCTNLEDIENSGGIQGYVHYGPTEMCPCENCDEPYFDGEVIIYRFNDPEEQAIGSTKTDDNGFYKINLQIGENYGVKVTRFMFCSTNKPTTVYLNEFTTVN